MERLHFLPFTRIAVLNYERERTIHICLKPHRVSIDVTKNCLSCFVEVLLYIVVNNLLNNACIASS